MNLKQAMDIEKLKLDKFKSVRTVNFPKEVVFGFEATKGNVEVIIYYVRKM